MQRFRKLLFPFSWIYQWVVWFRNVLYNKGILKSEKGALPTIIIGNVHVGGTGKSPHTLWLANALKSTFRLAILSRGYGRKTKGYLLWEPGMTADTFGDEPCQYARRLDSVRVAVCEDRLEGIRQISQTGNEQVVLLDDALQHRKLQGDVNVVLMRADELPQHSTYLPSGNLRDHLMRLQDADVVIVTGVEVYWTDEQLDDLKKHLKLPVGCIMSSSIIAYGAPLNAANEEVDFPDQVIVVTGIANAKSFIDHLSKHTQIVEHFAYSDHQPFRDQDWAKWTKTNSSSLNLPIITTEKDFMRMLGAAQMKSHVVLYVPIRVVPEDATAILQLISNRISPKK